MPRQPTPKEIIERDKRVAIRQSTVEGRKRLGVLLKKADALLSERFLKAPGLRTPEAMGFTTAQAGVVMTQVREVLKELHEGLKKDIVTTGKATATKASADTIKYVDAVEKKFRGVAAELPLKTAMIVDRVNAKTESSILHRIEADPKHPGRPGVLDRYDSNVVRQFEEELQLRMLARRPWSETRQAITEASPFLKGQPAFWAERIVRTEAMHAHNRASWETLREVDEQMGDMLKILSATFDDRTGADSYAVHGQVRRVDEPFESWFGEYMHPPNRPNDREVVVPHRMSWPLPADLEPMTDSDVDMRWEMEGRKGAPPARPVMSTVDRALIGKVAPPPMKPPVAAPPAPPTKPPVPSIDKPPPKPEPGKPLKLSAAQQKIITDVGAGASVKSTKYKWGEPVWRITKPGAPSRSFSYKTAGILRKLGLLVEKKIDANTSSWELTAKGKKQAAAKAPPKAPPKPVKPIELGGPVPKTTAPLTKAKVGPEPFGPKNPSTKVWADKAQAAMAIVGGEVPGVYGKAQIKAQQQVRSSFRALLKRDGLTTAEAQLHASSMGRIGTVKNLLQNTGVLAHIYPETKLVEVDRGVFKNARIAMTKLAKGKPPLNRGDINAIATLVHEEVHGYSRARARGGRASAIEEAATEAIARRQMDRLVGEGKMSKTSGSYQPEIDAVTSAIRKHVDVTKAEAFDMFAVAATKTRSVKSSTMQGAYDTNSQIKDITGQLPVPTVVQMRIAKELTGPKKWWPESRDY